MGLLYLGTPLTWDEVEKHADHVRFHGITQFLHTWDRLKDRHGDELLWGDEVFMFRIVSKRRLMGSRSNIWSWRWTTRERTRDCLYAKPKSWRN
jgi:hypothetical protein